MNVDFNQKVLTIRHDLENGQLLKDDMTTADKGGIAWKMLSIFTRVISFGHADINKHYRPRTVLVKVSNFIALNQHKINQNAELRQNCETMLDRLATSLNKQKDGVNIYAQSIQDISLAMRYNYDQANPAPAPAAPQSHPTPAPAAPQSRPAQTPQPKFVAPPPPPPPGNLPPVVPTQKANFKKLTPEERAASIAQGADNVAPKSAAPGNGFIITPAEGRARLRKTNPIIPK